MKCVGRYEETDGAKLTNALEERFIRLSRGMKP